MIAYLTTHITIGRHIARQELSLIATYEGRRHVLRPAQLEAGDLLAGAAIGFLATREDDLRGHELSGVVILDPVKYELIAVACSRLRKTTIGGL